MGTISAAIAAALEHHRNGRLQEAERIYREVLAVDANQPDAHHLLGVLAHQAGKPELAIESIRRAIRLKDTEGVFHNNLGNAFLDVGNLDEAAECYRRALSLAPDYANAHHNLGNALLAQKKPADAAECYRHALRLMPNCAEWHSDLGIALQEQHEVHQAVECYRRALTLKPDFSAANKNLGNALRELGKLEEAVAAYRRAIELNPAYADAYYELGNALGEQNQLDEAIHCYREALRFQPGLVDALNNLGNALRHLGKMPEAIATYRQALTIKPDFASAWSNLGIALYESGHLNDATVSYRQALELIPDSAETFNNLGIALTTQGDLDAGIACYQQALTLKPDFPEAYSNLGNAFKAQGNLEEAIACCRQALELKPDFVSAHSDLLLALNYSPHYDAKAIYQESCRWNSQHAQRLAEFIQPHANERSPDRRLRIGYASSHFCESVTALFMLPLLEAHDHDHFEIFCYASTGVTDSGSERCRAQSDTWRNVFGISDEDLSNLIRADGIDILVDLTMHGGGQRLLTFARKPAPVQVTYLAYVGTTGMTAIDYRFTDPYLDSARQSEPVYSEESVCLPETYWCYRPLSQTPRVNELPALAHGYITFGCLNSPSKVTAPVLAAWIGILQSLPDSKLILHAHHGGHRNRLLELFDQHGIAAERLDFLERTPAEEYFQQYHGIDLALDPFPYGGGTTTCDALWMGVPVVTLAGQTAVGRGGLSILSNLRQTDLVASDSDEYVRIAVELAKDLTRLAELRATLRERMQSSVLMDAPRFARNVEAAYRTMWRRWCEA